jgi:hypothetical protein
MDERKRLLMEGLQTLPERERTAVVLREIEGCRRARWRRFWAWKKSRCAARFRRRGEAGEVCSASGEETEMTCQECEGLLASEETSAGLDRHLAECSKAGSLLRYLRANADAFVR